MRADPKPRIASPSDVPLRKSLGVPLVFSACLLLGLLGTTIRSAPSAASSTGDRPMSSMVALACSDDAYEPDYDPEHPRDLAKPLPPGSAPQDHTFGYALDIDWVWVATPDLGKTYKVQTFDLAGGADTYMALYDRAGTLLKSNDDVDTARCLTELAAVGNSEYCRSIIAWVAENAGPYYLKLLTVRFPKSSCPTYRIAATGGAAAAGVYLPVVMAPPPTPIPTETPSPDPTDTPTPPPDPSLLYPNGLAVDPRTHLVYVTSRENGRLFVLDGSTLGEVGSVTVGDLPWGVAVNPDPAKNRVYVGNWRSQDVYVLDAQSRALLDLIPIGDFPTFVKLDAATNRVFVVKYGSSGLAVIDGNSNAVVASVGSGGVGAWGLAFNPSLNRVYISNRDSGTVTTLDGNNGYRVIEGQTVQPCGGTGSSPYAMDFNPNNNKLYIACSPFHNVDSAAIYAASASGLTRLALVAIGDGGEAGGGGVVVDTATGNAFFTNSRADTVSVIGGAVDRVIATVPVGSNPYGVAADPGTKRIFVGNRDSHDVTALSDTYTP